MKGIITVIFGFLLLSHNVFGQNGNIFHDRKFWKEKPSIEEIKVKIAEGNSPTELTEYNFDAIGYAILEKNPVETIAFLLEQGNDVNKLTHDARTYIFWAAYKGDLNLMKFLVKKGAQTDIVDQHGYTLFMFAAVTGQENQEIYDYITSFGVEVRKEKDRKGRNALLAYVGATETGEMLDYFLSQGLDINSVDKDGNGIFNHAAKTGNQKLLEKLRTEYKVSTEKNLQTNENAIFFASTRYSRSGEETDLAFYDYLESLGLDAAIVTKSGKTALHNLSFRTNNLEVYQYFMDKGVDLNRIDEDGNNALINAASRRNEEVISMLIENTEDLDHQNKEGMTAFARALKYNKLEIAKLFVESGATTNLTDANGYDMGYHLVDGFRNIEAFKEKMSFLLSLGYDPTTKQKDGSTLLHAAINQESVHLLEWLLDQGLDINEVDGDGQTILHYAAMQADDEEILKYLVASGADRNLTTEFDESAFDLAGANEVLNDNNTDLNFLRGGEE
ncbi:MAG: ankyrin repeat domain-containing protein [Bacteroidota bacterium]